MTRALNLMCYKHSSLKKHFIYTINIFLYQLVKTNLALCDKFNKKIGLESKSAQLLNVMIIIFMVYFEIAKISV